MLDCFSENIHKLKFVSSSSESIYIQKPLTTICSPIDGLLGAPSGVGAVGSGVVTKIKL